MSVFLRKLMVAVLPASFVLQRRLENGAIIRGYNKAGFGGRGAYIFGEALEPELEALHFFLEPGAVLIDIGANTGIYTLKAAKEVGEAGTVIALEPFTDMASFLMKSVIRNGFKNVRVRAVCASDTTGDTTLWLNYGRPTQFSLNREHEDTGISVLGVAIDDLYQWEKLSRVDYIKIDVQGAEARVLSGAKRCIGVFRPIIQTEVEFERFVTALPGYRVFQAPGSPNLMYLPEEKEGAVAVAGRLGWKMVEQEPVEGQSSGR
jgi:FkbM family methyltransferase